MRGPYDDAIEAVQGPAAGGDPPAAARAAERRPPGGKQLIRLLEILERSGYTQAAQIAVESAVGDQATDVFRERITTFTAAPSGDPALGAAAKGTRRSTKAAREAREALVPDEVGQAYVESVSPPTGPPGATGPYWESLGPWTSPNGQTYGASRVNVSGRIADIAVDPSNPAHVLAGAAGGGVWESFDRGGSWAARTDFQPTLTVGALAFDRQHPATVYCGTGEGNFYGYLGAGILRSTNGGTTWASLCTAPFVGQGFYDLLVDPANSQHLLAATTGGLYVSNDGGVTWTRR